MYRIGMCMVHSAVQTVPAKAYDSAATDTIVRAAAAYKDVCTCFMINYSA